MANYNTRKIYNRTISDDGANYNSGPFTIIVLESASAIDSIVDGIFGVLPIDDNALSLENIAAIVSIELTDDSTIASDIVKANGDIIIQENGNGFDSIISLLNNLLVSDIGIGNDNISIAGAFFVIDSENRLQPLGVLVLRDSRLELLPTTRDIIEEIPGIHGEIDLGTEYRSRAFDLHVATDEGYSPLEKAHLQRLFAKYLDPTKGAKTLIFSDDIEKTYVVKYSGKIDITQYPSWFEFTMPFKMSSPFIIGSFEKQLTGNGSLINEGTFETPLYIEISGAVTNPSIVIGSDTLTYTGTISTGQTLVIDTEKKTVKLNGNNALANYNGVFPMLQPGETSVTAGENVTIKWRDRWI